MTAFLGPLLAGGASAGVSALFNKFGSQQKTPKTPKFQRQLIDQLLQGLQGGGPFASLFQADIGAFQKSVSDPLQQQFRDVTAPGIQQSFISSGQQRGTPLESALGRAGLDVQQDINKLFLPFQQGAQTRQQDAISRILGFQTPQSQTQLTPFGAGAAGLAQSGSIEELIKQLTQSGGGGGGQQNIGFNAGINRGGNLPTGFSQ